MRIIFIRHGDPDYKNDTLTEKGWREAKLLAERVCKWPVKEFYCSPLGRAKDTASCSLEKMNRKATIYEWLQEFKYPITDPTTGRYGVPWDFMPSYWTNEPLFYDKEHWHAAALTVSCLPMDISGRRISIAPKSLRQKGYRKESPIPTAMTPSLSFAISVWLVSCSPIYWGLRLLYYGRIFSWHLHR